MKKKTQGRKKIEIKKITDDSSRQVTFSKRRTGVFNKASELCVLTGAEAAIIVKSPGDRVFAFGHPSVDSVVDKYLAGTSSRSEENVSVNQVDMNSTSMHENFNQKYKEITKEIEDEKNKINVVENKEVEDGSCWWEESCENLGIEELEKYIASMEELKNNLMIRADEMAMIRNSSTLDVNQNSKNEGLMDAFLVDDQNTDGGTDQMLPYPPGFNFGSD